MGRPAQNQDGTASLLGLPASPPCRRLAAAGKWNLISIFIRRAAASDVSLGPAYRPRRAREPSHM